MTKKVRSAREIETCLRMAHCSSDEVASWLRGRPITYSTMHGVPATPAGSHLPEYILYRRRDLAIDVELAAHARSRTVLGKLYDRGSPSLKVVLAGNASLFVGDLHGTNDEPLRERDERRHLLWTIVESGSPGELRAICENADIYQEFFGDLISIWKQDDPTKFDEKRFQTIVRLLGNNALISQGYKESRFRHELDGFVEVRYDRLFVEGWRLAGRVAVTRAWAEALATLYERLHRPIGRVDNVDEIISRWFGEVGKYEADRYRDVRMRICVAFVTPTLAELRSDDPARRDAFLRTFDPMAPEFRDLDWNEFSSLDRYWHFNVRQNMKVWASPSSRDTFRRMLWKDSARDSNLSAIGFFDEQREGLKALHPEWFVEPADILEPEDKKPSEIDRLREDIRQLIETASVSRNAWLVAGGLFVAGLLIGRWL